MTDRLSEERLLEMERLAAAVPYMNVPAAALAPLLSEVRRARKLEAWVTEQGHPESCHRLTWRHVVGRCRDECTGCTCGLSEALGSAEKGE